MKKRGLFSGLSRAEQERLAVQETTLVYALANTFKDQDRLTQRDIDAARNIVNIFSLTRSSADVRASIERPDEYWANNVTTTTNVQKICHKKEIQLLYASSSCIHNWWLSPYGTSKKVNEETAHHKQVGLRFTTIY